VGHPYGWRESDDAQDRERDEVVSTRENQPLSNTDSSSQGTPPQVELPDFRFSDEKFSHSSETFRKSVNYD
jgi:hypothetical protein